MYIVRIEIEIVFLLLLSPTELDKLIVLEMWECEFMYLKLPLLLLKSS